MAISKILQERVIDLSSEIDKPSKEGKAGVIGINRSTFSNIYNYGIVPRTPALVKIADYFNVSVAYLMGESDSDYFSPIIEKVPFTSRLDSLLQEKNIKTLYDLSQKVHIHRNNIRQWYTADCLPLIDDLFILADFFGVSVDYLLGRTDDR